jgi:hypothetical protein
MSSQVIPALPKTFSSSLDLWREKNDQLVRQAKVMWLLGLSPCTLKMSESGFVMISP